MASDEMDVKSVPPDKIYDKYYVCHPKKKVTAVICILCDAAYCRSEFIKNVEINEGRFITSSLIICPEHKITNKNDVIENFESLNEESKIMISIFKKRIELLKIELEEKCNEIKKYQLENENKLIQTTDINEDEISELSYIKNLNSTLKASNDESRDHNTELRESNAFLRKLIEEKTNGNKNYANVLKSSKNKLPVNIIIKGKENYNGNVLDEVRKEILKTTEVPILSLNSYNEEKFVIKYKNESDSKNLNEILKKSIGNKLKINVEERKNPLIKVAAIQNDLEIDDLEQDIANRNNISTDNIKVKHIYKNKQTNKRNAI